MSVVVCYHGHQTVSSLGAGRFISESSVLLLLLVYAGVWSEMLLILAHGVYFVILFLDLYEFLVFLKEHSYSQVVHLRK